MKRNKKIITLGLTADEAGNHTVTSYLYEKDNDNQIIMPYVTYAHVGKRGIDDYAERKKVDVVDGYSIKLAENVIFNVFILADGSHEYENLHADLLTIAGNATGQASYLRGAVQSANAYAHTAKNTVLMYQNFFGLPTAEHKAWAEQNLPSFEQVVAEAKERVRLKQEANGNENK